MNRVPEVQHELLELGLVQAVLRVQVVPDDLRQLAAPIFVPWAARGQVHEQERDEDDEENDRDHPEHAADDEDREAAGPATRQGRDTSREQSAPVGAPCCYCQVTLLLVR